MDPITIAMGLSQFVPSIIKWISGSDKAADAATAPVDVVVDMTKLTLDTISLAGFDYHFDSFSRPTLHPFLQSLARALQEAIDVLRRPPFLEPLYRRHRARYQQDIASMFSLVDAVIQERKQKPKESWPRDFLSLMLEEADPKSGEKLSDENSHS